MLLTDAPLTKREAAMKEPLPLATVWKELAAYLMGTPDLVLFGSHAVNAYVAEERMSSDVDVLSREPAQAAEEIRRFLSERFAIETGVREPRAGVFRIHEVRQPKNRALVDVHEAREVPPHQMVEGLRVLAPVELAARKAIAMTARAGKDKGLSDQLDLHRLAQAFPALGIDPNAVTERLRSLGAHESAIAGWLEIARQPLEPDDDDKFDWSPDF